MLSKSILIGLFVLKNNRTREPKSLQGGRKGYCTHMYFFSRLWVAQENEGVFW